MDLIYTNAKREDQGVLSAYAFDLSYGASENDFEMTLGANEAPVESGAFIYMEGTEYGGIVDGLKTSTGGETITYKGRTWHGMMNSKVILPLKDGEQRTGKLRRLPKGYTELSHIETTGTQYIDTGFTPNQDSRVITRFKYKSGTHIYGTRQSASSSTSASRNFVLRAISGNWQPCYGYTLGGTGVPHDNEWHTADQDKNIFRIDGIGEYDAAALTEGTTVENGILTKVFDVQTFTAPRTFLIGAINSAASGGNIYIGKSCFAETRMYDNGVLVRDYIPCTNPDGIPGMYDIANDAFYRNAGTGEFLTGEVIETVDVIINGNDANGNSLVDSHLVIGGDANDCIAFIVDRLGLSGLFVAEEKFSGVSISGYQFNRYCKGYDGIRAMLAAGGAKLKIAWKDRSVALSAEPIADYTNAPVDGDIATLTVEQHKQKVNHLICLGKGDLAEREVIHLYVDQFGKISDVQHYTGLDEIADTYDNSNSENLRSDGITRFAELRNIDKAEIALPETERLVYDIGDIVGASDIKTGVTVAETVTQKIVKINNGVVSTEYRTGG